MLKLKLAANQFKTDCIKVNHFR